MVGRVVVEEVEGVGEGRGEELVVEEAEGVEVCMVGRVVVEGVEGVGEGRGEEEVVEEVEGTWEGRGEEVERVGEGRGEEEEEMEGAREGRGEAEVNVDEREGMEWEEVEFDVSCGFTFLFSSSFVSFFSRPCDLYHKGNFSLCNTLVTSILGCSKSSLTAVIWFLCNAESSGVSFLLFFKLTSISLCFRSLEIALFEMVCICRTPSPDRFLLLRSISGWLRSSLRISGELLMAAAQITELTSKFTFSFLSMAALVASKYFSRRAPVKLATVPCAFSCALAVACALAAACAFTSSCALSVACALTASCVFSVACALTASCALSVDCALIAACAFSVACALTASCALSVACASTAACTLAATCALTDALALSVA